MRADACPHRVRGFGTKSRFRRVRVACWTTTPAGYNMQTDDAAGITRTEYIDAVDSDSHGIAHHPIDLNGSWIGKIRELPACGMWHGVLIIDGDDPIFVIILSQDLIPSSIFWICDWANRWVKSWQLLAFLTAGAFAGEQPAALNFFSAQDRLEPSAIAATWVWVRIIILQLFKILTMPISQQNSA